jgi:hypothetical protein
MPKYKDRLSSWLAASRVWDPGRLTSNALSATIRGVIVQSHPGRGGTGFVKSNRVRSTTLVLVLIATGPLPGCRSSETSTPSPSSSEVDVPTTVNLYPDGSNVRLFIKVSAVGTQKLGEPAPLAVDTGSAGMTLYAALVFPASIVTPCVNASDVKCGFAFPSGVHSISYNGITITDLQGVRCYGGSTGRTEIGNVGYAPVTFGDASGSLTTTQMPIFFYYKITKSVPTKNNTATCNDGTEVVTTAEAQQGWFGINTDANPVLVATVVPPATAPPLCEPNSTSTCSVVSVLKYVQFGPELEPGFVLSPATLQPCSITAETMCVLEPMPMLTVGLTPAIYAAFDTHQLDCTTATSYGSFPVCDPHVPKGTVTVSQDGSQVAALANTEILFDTGTLNFQIQDSASGKLPLTTPMNGPQQLDASCTVTFTTPAGFSYSYQTTDGGTTQTQINTQGIGSNVVGIHYFEQHSLLVDFGAGVEGWM